MYELAVASLGMFCQRPGAPRAVHAAGAVQALVRALRPDLPPGIVEAAASAVGSLAADGDCRLAFRSAGGVGALVRLTNALDCDRGAQACCPHPPPLPFSSCLAARVLMLYVSERQWKPK